MDSKLYWQENMGTHDPETVHYLFSAGEVRRLDAEKDKLLLRNIARHGDGIRQKAALRKLGVEAVPAEDPDYTSDGLFDEAYFLAEEQVRQVADPELLREVAFRGFGEKRYFAFCRLTGYRYPAPACDAYSHRTFACGRLPGLADEEVLAFCREMVDKKGPFAREAQACLEKLPEVGDP